jgi:hypothetical protein
MEVQEETIMIIKLGKAGMVTKGTRPGTRMDRRSEDLHDVDVGRLN